MHAPGIAISRRALLAGGGGGIAAAAVAACGTEAEDPSTTRDVELLGAAVAAERALTETYGFAADSVGGSVAPALRQFAAASERRVEELTTLLEEQGGTADDVADNPPNDAESAVEAATLDLQDALAAYREAAGLLSEEAHRRTALGYMAEDAAELTLLQDVLGEPEAPQPFVTGGEERPLVAPGPIEEDE
jgi:hypothetical protein